MAEEGIAGKSRAEQGRRGEGRETHGKARHSRARAGLVTADGIVSCDHLHASGVAGSSVGTHEAFLLPGSLFAIEPIGGNVTFGASVGVDVVGASVGVAAADTTASPSLQRRRLLPPRRCILSTR
jgi:hypothetical protein